MKWICLIAALSLPIAQAAQEDNKALFERACTKCHTLTAVTDQHNSPARWSNVVDKMVARGADITDEEIVKIIDYLSKNFGPRLKINTADAGEISEALGIPKSAAGDVVAYRSKNGPFHSLDDLKKVTSVDAADLERKKDSLDFSVPKESSAK
jgi:competence protein ComEA